MLSDLMLSELHQLTNTQKAALQRGGFTSVSDLMLNDPRDIAKQSKLGLSEITAIIRKVCQESVIPIQLLEQQSNDADLVFTSFTTGDPGLDDVLGGGFRTGMVWECAGESASGKSQLAMQLSLSVQLPQSQGGLFGFACYLTTSTSLPTARLLQIGENHPLFSPWLFSLERIHTISTPTVAILLPVLRFTLPNFLQEWSAGPNPVKLLVIDAISQLFLLATGSAKDKLIDRSRSIAEISALLHSLAQMHGIAVLVLNATSDVFDQRPSGGANSDMRYREQARWFNQAHSLPGKDRKEARLGLPWANQVNVRLLLSRTERHRLLDTSSGRQPLYDFDTSINIVFSTVGQPRSIDVIIAASGVHTVSES